MPGVAAVVLAAGGSTRFAGPAHKLLTEVRGKPLVAHALDNALAAGIGQVVAVWGAVDLGGVIPDGVLIVHNAAWAEGQATSLAAAVRWGEERGLEAIVVGLGDQPGIAPVAWRAVAATDSPIAVATYAGRRGHPVRLGRAVWPRLPATGDQGARVVMAASPELVAEVACEGDPTDVDTVEDLGRWR